MNSSHDNEHVRRLPPGHVHSLIKEHNEIVSDCIEKGVRVPLGEKEKIMSPTRARQVATKHAKEILASWKELHHILERQEGVIRRRWMKRNKEQRKKILLTAWPNMNKWHRSDFQRVFHPSKKRDPDDEEIYKWPHVNLEDLVEARPLLLLLNARGRTAPRFFAHADQVSFDIGRQYDQITQYLVPCRTMFLIDGKDVDSYGRLAPLHSEKDMHEFLTNHQLHFNPTGGLLVLEVQSRLLRFLLACCHELLGDIPCSLLTGTQLPVLPEPAPLVSSETSYIQVSVMVAEAPYRTPTVIDTARMMQLIEARKLAAEDHAWTLREDPGCFASVMSDYHLHCTELLHRVPEHLSRDESERDRWNQLISLAHSEAYVQFITWDMLYQKAVSLHTQTWNNFDQYDRQRPLPKRIEETIIDMAAALDMLVRRLVVILRVAVPVCADLPPNVLKAFDQSTDKTKWRRMPNGLPDDPLARLFGLLCEEACKGNYKIGLPLIVEEMQRMLDRQPSQKKRLSSFVAGIFSDLALVSHVLDHLTSIQPWAANFGELIGVRREKRLCLPPDALLASIGLLHNNLSHLITPISVKFHYPIDKAYNKTNVDAVQQAEANLDIFWAAADRELEKRTFTTAGYFTDERTHRPRNPRRTSPWTPPRVTPPPAVELGTFEGSFNNLCIEANKPGRLRADTPREKTKTRPQEPASAIETSHEKADSSNAVVQGAKKFEISSRALGVFRLMFHTVGTAAEQQRAIPWKAFLHAMTAMGFSAEKHYGSIWHFVPSRPEMKQSINFHEPHPDSKIPFCMARSFGKRFHRAYGWTGENFSE